jgi:serine/threonine-protein kinase
MIIGKYRLKERLGVGGMAEVFRAEVIGAGGFHRTVALKRILPQYLAREDFQKMFIDEARICASLTHANLVQIFDFDRARDGTYYLAMELIEGVDLRRLTDALAGGPMPPTLALLIASEVLKGLAYAHERVVKGEPLGLIHRDVTPQNILLSWAGEVKLSDFGLAKAKMRLSQTQPGIIKGKFAYLAPEQLEGPDFDHRVDIFSLGVVLWEMLTGHRLFWAESDAETLKKLLGRVPEPPSEIEPSVPRELDDVVLYMLAHSPENRPARARDALWRIGNLLHQMATDASQVDLGAFLAKTFAKELEESRIVEQRSPEEENTRQIDGNKLRELSMTVPNFPLSSPLFAKARQEAAEISKDRHLEELAKGKPR